MHSWSPSAYPCISANGVFNSWDTLDRNSFRIRSISSFFSMSFFSSLFALFNSEIVVSNVADSIFICSPNSSTSFWRLFGLYFASKSSSAILFEIFVSCRIGPVIRRLTKIARMAQQTVAMTATYAKNSLAIITLSLILANAVRINTRLPSSKVPHSTR